MGWLAPPPPRARAESTGKRAVGALSPAPFSLLPLTAHDLRRTRSRPGIEMRPHPDRKMRACQSLHGRHRPC
jgi:hypothetical protein